MRNVVFGSEGFVGIPFTHFLKDLGEEVVEFDIKRDSKEDLRYAELDFSGIDRVYFLAWDVGGAKYLYEQDSQFQQLDWNLKLLLNVMPQLQTAKIPFLFISSQLAEEYDTVYGVTKRLGEVWTHLLKGVRVRLWNVYGPIETPSQRTHVVSDFVHQAVLNGRLEMMTTGEERRQFIHIDDVCRAFHRALDLNLEGVYDISSFEWVRILDIAQIIAEETGAAVIVGDHVGTTPFTPMKGRVPGWLPQVDLRQGLRRMITELQSKLKIEKKKR
jgi:nucleoside-diphosphate-sugar epimerase